jgi:hypothetical protein
MAKKSKGKQSISKKKKPVARRQERRFVSQTSTSATLVRVLGALSAILLGAGLWGYVYAKSFTEEALKPVPSYLIAGGAVLMGITIWVGTSSESPLRVGAPGIAMEKGEVRRMPWWGVKSITFDSTALALQIIGNDEAGVAWTFKVPLKSHAEAVGWILKEALDRIPRRVKIPEETLEKMPVAGEHAGMKVDLEPLQVVGKKCAVTGKTISYEPDARVCPRCERVYVKKSVPKKCKCGNSLVHMRPTGIEDDMDMEETDEDERIDEEADEDELVRTSSEKLEAAAETEDAEQHHDHKEEEEVVKKSETADT